MAFFTNKTKSHQLEFEKQLATREEWIAAKEHWESSGFNKTQIRNLRLGYYFEKLSQLVFGKIKQGKIDESLDLLGQFQQYVGSRSLKTSENGNRHEKRVAEFTKIISRLRYIIKSIQTNMVDATSHGELFLQKGNTINVAGIDYTIDESLNKPNAKIFICKNSAGKKFILKEALCQFDSMYSINGLYEPINESNILESLNNKEGIVNFFGKFYHMTDDFIVVGSVLEYCGEKDLGKKLADLDGDIEKRKILFTGKIIHQLISTLQKIHASNIIHHDLAPANIMIDENDNAKIIDFGASHLGASLSNNEDLIEFGLGNYNLKPMFTPGYYNNNDKARVDKDSDVYSLGCILFLMFTGKEVKYCLNDGDENDDRLAIDQYVRDERDYDIIKAALDTAQNDIGFKTTQIKDLICDCLNYQREKRPDMELVSKRYDEWHIDAIFNNEDSPATIVQVREYIQLLDMQKVANISLYAANLKSAGADNEQLEANLGDIKAENFEKVSKTSSQDLEDMKKQFNEVVHKSPPESQDFREPEEYSGIGIQMEGEFIEEAGQESFLKVKVVHVFKNSPAFFSGILENDELIIPAGNVADAFKKLRNEGINAANDIKVKRDDQEIDITVPTSMLEYNRQLQIGELKTFGCDKLVERISSLSSNLIL